MTPNLLNTGLRYQEESYAQVQARYSGFGEELFSRLENHFPGFISKLRFFHPLEYQVDDVWAVFDDGAIQFGIQLEPNTPVVVLWNRNPDSSIEIGDWTEDVYEDVTRFIEEEFFAKGPSKSLPPAWWH